MILRPRLCRANHRSMLTASEKKASTQYLHRANDADIGFDVDAPSLRASSALRY